MAAVAVMTVEIERKFLVAELPAEAASWHWTPIRQGYLALEEAVEVRLRVKGLRCFETVKKGRGLVRGELEVELEPAQLEALWPATEGRRVEKERAEVSWGGVVLEVDRFTGRHAGLLLAEVELATVEAAAAFVPPDWFGPEVTGDPRYANRQLAVDGLPPGDR